MKLYLEPRFDKPDTGEGGIRRIVEAQSKYLPLFGVELVDDINQADLTAGHGGARPLVAGKPFVSHSHGLYWSDYNWMQGEQYANRRVIDSLLCADAITVPSRWVRNAYTRGLLRDPQVIYHGIELAEWTPGEPGGYVLYNKPRQDAVCDTSPVDRLVRLMPDVQFVSTFGTPAPNVRLAGRMPYTQMKGVIQSSSVYLALPRETFGIGTLEALASGVPVAGWNYGGQREIVVQGETGYLAEPGNFPELAECIRKCFAERARLGANARADAATRWGWLDKMEQYAALYQCVLHQREARQSSGAPTVSVIVTCHDLAKYLPAALDSVREQTLSDWECIIVDDASADETGQVAKRYAQRDDRFSYARSDENLKLSRARNFGIARARGRYLINLDADDVLTPDALRLQVNALEANPHLHIAYGSLEILSEDGTEHHPNAFPQKFNYLEQMAHLNQLYYAALMRREVWEQVGGNRERMWRAEDAEFWCRAISFGFRAAKVTEAACLYWRFRADGKSATERRTYPDIDGDWTADFPWAIAHDMKAGVEKKKANALVLPNPDTVPFGSPVANAPIYHREQPLVSIIIPLGPGHDRYVIDALDSCVAQTEHRWEAIVVSDLIRSDLIRSDLIRDDTGDHLQSIPGAPYARIIQTAGRVGAGGARNVGLAHARGALVLFLDADDQLHPDALKAMVDEYAKGAAGYVYSGWKVIRPNREVVEFEAKPYDRQAWLIGKAEGRNIVTVLMATEDARRLGGFDGEMFAYEDWDFFCKCAVEGACGVPLKGSLVTYRHYAGQRSVSATPRHTELVQLIRARYADYREGRAEMAQCCGGNKKALQEIQAARAAIRAQMDPAKIGMVTQANTPGPAPVPEGYLRMEFTGERRGPVTYYANGRPYTGANAPDWKFVNAKLEDVEKLERMGVWKRVKALPPPPAGPTVQLVDPPPPPPPPARIRSEPMHSDASPDVTIPAPAAVPPPAAAGPAEVEPDQIRPLPAKQPAHVVAAQSREVQKRPTVTHLVSSEPLPENVTSDRVRTSATTIAAETNLEAVHVISAEMPPSQPEAASQAAAPAITEAPKPARIRSEPKAKRTNRGKRK